MTKIARVIPLLVYEDIPAAHDFLVGAFGFTPGRVDRDQEGHAVHGELRAGDLEIWLHRVTGEHKMSAHSAMSATSSGFVVFVDDVDAHYKQARTFGAKVESEPADIEKETLNKPIICAHFVTATQVALDLALNYPDKIGKVIIMGGSPYRYTPSRKNGTTMDWDKEYILTPQQRNQLIEAFWAPKWFKTVTKKTWDDNMWTPGDYCKDSVTGKQLFKTSADVPLQVMIRYLIEWMAYDPSGKYKDITVPTLILIPDFNGVSLTPDSLITTPNVNNSKQYLKYFHQQPWMRAKESGNALLQVHTVPDTRLFMWYDNPAAVYSLINDFVKK